MAPLGDLVFTDSLSGIRTGGQSALLLHRKGLQGETANVLDVHVAVLQLDLVHLLLRKSKAKKH